MIKPIELRLGNRIYKHFEGGPGEEIEVSVRDIFDAQRSIVEKSFKFSFSSIPLTEEWLLKFGGERTKDAWTQSYRVNGRLLIKEKNGFRDCESNVSLLHVHKFQNFMFEVTGKELELTPSTV